MLEQLTRHQRIAALSAIVLLAFLTTTLLESVAAQATQPPGRPLLMEGKKTLFQRVLTRPAAQLRAEPRADAAAVGDPMPAFEMFYVYERQGAAADAQWLRVGRSNNGETQGWIAATQAIDWKQNIVVAFNHQVDRDRELLFSDRDKLMNLIRANDRAARTATLRTQAAAGHPPAESGVVSIEPDTYIDINRQLYILPILGFTDDFIGEYKSQILHVASIPKDPQRAARIAREKALKDFKVGIVFVIDTTLSMDPYIDRTRDAVEKIYRRIVASPIGRRASFGLVGFRDATRPLSQIEYVTKTFVPLSPDQKPDTVLQHMREVHAATVSTQFFTQDSLSGVKSALEMTKWDPFGGRYIVLITDAGPLPASDPSAQVHESPQEINGRAIANQVAIYTLHLLTPNGRPDHENAEAAYRALSHYQHINSYFGVPNGSVDAFGGAVDHLADSLIAQIGDTLEGRLTEAGPPGGSAVDSARAVGRAMQLAYLGRVEETRAPDLFEAWIADKDLTNPAMPALDVRLLLSKSQLSAMHDVIKSLVDSFEGSQTARRDPAELFKQLRSAIALMTRTPERVGNAQFATLGEAMGEFLDGLPYYSSEVATMTEETWANIGGARQREIVDSLKQNLAHFEALHNTPDLWTALYEGAPDGDRVYPMPIDALP